MKIDTSTYATVISETDYKNYFKNCNLIKIEQKLKTYDGKIFKNKEPTLECFILPLHIINTRKNEINNLNIKNIANELILKFKDLFSDIPGCYNKSKTNLF